METENPKPKWWLENGLLKLAGIATPVVVIAGAVFLFFPRLRPSPPPDINAGFTAITVESFVNYEDFLQRNNHLLSKNFTCVEAKSTGVIIEPIIRLDGLKNRELSLLTSFRESGSNRRVPDSWYVPNLRHLLYNQRRKPEQHKDVWSPKAWLPLPVARGDYYLHIELILQDGEESTTLYSQSMEPITVQIFPKCAGAPPQVPYLPDTYFPPGHEPYPLGQPPKTSPPLKP